MGINKEETIKYKGYNTGKYFSDLVSNPLICDKCNNSRVLSMLCKHTGRAFTWCPKCNSEYDEEDISLPCESDDYWDSLPNPCYEVHWIEKQYSDDLVSFMIKIADIIGIDASKYESYNMNILNDDIMNDVRHLKITEERLIPFQKDICSLLGVDSNRFRFHADIIDKIKTLQSNRKHKTILNSILHKRKDH